MRFFQALFEGLHTYSRNSDTREQVTTTVWAGAERRQRQKVRETEQSRRLGILSSIDGRLISGDQPI